MKLCYNTNFTLLKQSQRSRSVLLFWKENNLFYNQRNTVYTILLPISHSWDLHSNVHSINFLGIGGGVEGVILAEVTRTSEEEKRTGIISILISIRQTGLLIGMLKKKQQKNKYHTYSAIRLGFSLSRITTNN